MRRQHSQVHISKGRVEDTLQREWAKSLEAADSDIMRIIKKDKIVGHRCCCYCNTV